MKRRTFRLRWWIALGIAVAAIAAPTSQARPLSDQNGRALPVVRHHVQVQSVKSEANSFNWNYVYVIVGSVAAVSLLAAAAAGTRSGRIVWNVR